MLILDLEPVFQAEITYERAVNRFSDRVRGAVQAAVTEGATEAIQTHHYQDQTGLLTSRIRGYVEISAPGGAAGIIGAFTDYASYVDGGTKPHEIHPRLGGSGPVRQGQGRRGASEGTGSGLLTFKGSDGRWVSVRMVNHPGTSPDGFMGRAFQKAERVIIRDVEVAAAELQRELDG